MNLLNFPIFLISWLWGAQLCFQSGYFLLQMLDKLFVGNNLIFKVREKFNICVKNLKDKMRYIS